MYSHRQGEPSPPPPPTGDKALHVWSRQNVAGRDPSRCHVARREASKRSRHPRVLRVCHSDAGRVWSLSETLPFCSVGALRSPPR